MTASERPATGPDDAAPFVLEATRSLLGVGTDAEARRLTEDLVRRLGARVAPASTGDVDTIPIDVSFGDGAPRLPAAPMGSVARRLVEQYVEPFVEDARRLLQANGRAERLAESSSTDPLTGLPNRRSLDRALGRLAGDDTVIMLDLDHFKRVNDELGHAAGDNVLREFGTTLASTVRGRESAGRFGGEEFVVVLAAASGAEAFLQRLRTEWSERRPIPITFSAGIARFVGDPDQTMAMADEALYRAKDAGRDQWQWATSVVPSAEQPRDYVQPYLDDAVTGNRRPAIRLTLDLLDHRVPEEQIVSGLLATAQREVGERWFRNELSAADEHVASGVAAAALDALAGESGVAVTEGLTVVACAEGDWHSLAAQMVGESLRALGSPVSVIGASVPARAVGEFVERVGADALAISCSLPVYFPGAVRCIDVAHRRGTPVIVGGRAFGDGPRRANRLGADAWAADAVDAAAILSSWRATPPSVTRDPTPLDPVALHLFENADLLGGAARDRLADDGIAGPEGPDLVSIVHYLAAARLVDDRSIFVDYLRWLQEMLAFRSVAPEGLVAGLDALTPGVLAVDDSTEVLIAAGRRQLLGAQRTRS